MYEELISKAGEALERAYAPYSNFRVGAALAGKNRIYTGCNIENVSFGATCCAERTAIFKAVSHGITDFEAMAIVSDSGDFTFPCGICLQVISEFNIPKIILVKDNGEYKEFALEELIPHAFDRIIIKNT